MVATCLQFLNKINKLLQYGYQTENFLEGLLERLLVVIKYFVENVSPKCLNHFLLTFCFHKALRQLIAHIPYVCAHF